MFSSIVSEPVSEAFSEIVSEAVSEPISELRESIERVILSSCSLVCKRQNEWTDRRVVDICFKQTL